MPDAARAALLVVDVQNDFCPGGALPVPDGNRVVAALNFHIDRAVKQGMPVYASRDWHPPITTHFAPYGGTWPVHCVRGTQGAAFHPQLRLPAAATVVTKGESPDSPGYSAFEGRTADGVPLREELRQRGITRLFVGGLATDYCVRYSVLDALAAGLEVQLLQDAIAGVDVQPGDAERALAEMRARGATVVAGIPAKRLSRGRRASAPPRTA
jgi:nicotinamidase/pyrazinamidase